MSKTTCRTSVRQSIWLSAFFYLTLWWNPNECYEWRKCQSKNKREKKVKQQIRCFFCARKTTRAQWQKRTKTNLYSAQTRKHCDQIAMFSTLSQHNFPISFFLFYFFILIIALWSSVWISHSNGTEAIADTTQNWSNETWSRTFQ